MFSLYFNQITRWQLRVAFVFPVGHCLEAFTALELIIRSAQFVYGFGRDCLLLHCKEPNTFLIV
jgi:hypothetical protein